MSTETHEEEFWDSLRRAVADSSSDQPGDATPIDQADVDAAEVLLADVDREPPVPLTAAQVDTIVRRAMADIEGSAARSVAEHVAPGPLRGRTNRLLAVAMAVCVTPMFLTATAVVTATAVTTLILRHTSRTLRFQDAVRHLVADHSPDTTRNPALGAVYADLLGAIRVVKQVAAGASDSNGGLLLATARDSLQRVRAELGRADRFVLRPMPDDWAALVATVQDRGLRADLRQNALHRLTDLMLYGVRALKEIEHSPLSDRIAQQLPVVLTQLARLLDE